MLEINWYIAFGITIIATFLPLFLFLKNFIYITLHHREMSKEEIILKKQSIDRYIFVTYIFFELAYFCLQTIMGSKFGPVRAIAGVIGVLIKTWLTAWVFGIFTKALIEQKNVTQKKKDMDL